MQVADDAFAVVKIGELAEVGLARGVEWRHAGVDRLDRHVVYEAQVTLDVVDGLRAADLAVARHDRRRTDRPQALTRADGAFHGTHQHEWCPAVEDQVAGEEHAVVGQPGDDVAVGVCGSADVVQLDPSIAGVHVEPVVEDDRRWPNLEVAPVDRAEDGLEPTDDLRPHTLATVAMPDDARVGEQAVAVGVVAVVRRVDQCANRGVRMLCDRRVALALFADWATARGVEQPREVTRPVVERYQRALLCYRQPGGRPLTFRSQTARLVALRAFYRWLARTRRVLINPTAELELPAGGRWQPRTAMTVSEVEDTLAQPDINTPDGLRDRAILEVFYSTGIRAAELAALHLYDLDSGRGTLAVNAGKGGRSRIVPIAERAVGWCDKWTLDGRPHLAVPPDANRLFVNNRGGPLSTKTLTAIARRHLDAAGVVKPGACHLFRHTAATLMLEGGADIRYIQAMLGHAELTTTQLYTHVAVGPLKAVHERCHPGAGNRPPRIEWPPRPDEPDPLDTVGNAQLTEALQRRIEVLVAKLNHDERLL